MIAVGDGAGLDAGLAGAGWVAGAWDIIAGSDGGVFGSAERGAWPTQTAHTTADAIAPAANATTHWRGSLNRRLVVGLPSASIMRPPGLAYRAHQRPEG